MDLPHENYRGYVGVTDQTRVYVATCSLEISLKTQSDPDSVRLVTLRRLNWEKNFVIVTPTHPEVTPRNWSTMTRET